MTFHVGQKVVCIDAKCSLRVKTVLVEGAIYEVSAVGMAFGKLFLGLRETPRLSGPLHWEARRFRPVVDRKTNISIFTEILDRENANKRALETTDAL